MTFFGKQNKKVLFLIIIGCCLIFVFDYFFHVIKPSEIATKIFALTINHPEALNSFIGNKIRILSYFSIALLVLFLIRHTQYYSKIVIQIIKLCERIAEFISLKTLFIFSFIYLCILFPIAVNNYDLGYDEAWYLNYANNFSTHLFPFYKFEGKIALIDNLTMLPMYFFSLVNYSFGFTKVWHFKFLASLMSIFSLFIIIFTVYKKYTINVAILFLFLVIIQPGFGFIASSFFGEVIAVCFLFLAAYFLTLQKSVNVKGRLFILSLLFVLSIHTKFQIFPLIIGTLVILYLLERETVYIKIIFYVILMTVLVAFLRLIPAIVYDSELTVKYLKQFYWMITSYNKNSSILIKIDRLQLFNRFFPLLIFLFFYLLAFIKKKNTFERFLFIFSSLTIFWWIFSFGFSTYRHLFLGLIPFLFVITVTLVSLWNEHITKNGTPKRKLNIKYLTAFIFLIVMLYGFSANIIYASVGYNDGVQFDLDGHKSRLFNQIKNDKTQKMFYSNIKNFISPDDTLFTPSPHLTNFYLPNPVSSFDEPIGRNTVTTNPKFVIISRESYPLDLSKGRKLLENLSHYHTLVLKEGNFELYEIR